MEDNKKNLPTSYVTNVTNSLYDGVDIVYEKFYTDDGDKIDVYNEDDIYPLLASLQSIVEICESAIEDLKPSFEEDK